MRVQGKVVIVTGAGQGQGAAEARLLAAEGAHVIGCDVTLEPAQDIAGVEYRQLDVTDIAGWAALGADVKTRHGQVEDSWPTPGVAGGLD